MIWFGLVFGLIVFIIFLISYYYNKSEIVVEKFIEKSTPCLCVFDLDRTLTCSYNNAKKAVDTCRNFGCRFAINTARLSPYIGDVPLKEIGLKFSDISGNIYHGSSYPMATNFEDVAKTKVDHLYTLMNKYDVPKKKIILFDDLYSNIEGASQNGFSTVFANNPMCGINNDVSAEIDKILNI